MRRHVYPLKVGITRSKKFERKLLATHAVNVGLRCGHGCLYCSSPALLRCHPGFKATGESPFGQGYSIVDPETPARIAQDVRKSKREHIIMFCSATDAWSPEAQEFDIGRRTLQVLLEEGRGTVRVLTKNVAVKDSFDLMARRRDRVILGLSVTAPASRQGAIEILEPNASPIGERLVVLKEAHHRGIRTYGMICPCIPGVADSEKALEEIFDAVLGCGPEEIWLEPLNARGNGLVRCTGALADNGFVDAARAIDLVRSRPHWSEYVLGLVRNAQRVAERNGVIDRLHILLYRKSFLPESAERLQGDGRGVVWL